MITMEKDSASVAMALSTKGARESWRQICPLLLEIVHALNVAGVPYCYFKDSSKLDRVLSGRSDLDLLAPRRARDLLVNVMQSHGFKQWSDAPALSQREFTNFFGYDERAGLILHVHVHFRLVLGDSLAKVFHIPIEEALVSRRVTSVASPLQILDPTDEALLRRMRDALEGGWLDVVSRRSRVGAERARSATQDAGLVQGRALSFLSTRAAESISRADPADYASLRALRRELKRELGAFRLIGPVAATMRLIYRTLFLALAALNRKYLGRPMFARRNAPGGGVLVAFVGVDGSGKSTQLARTREWLGSHIDVTTIYFGTGDGAASLLFRPIKSLAEAIGRRISVKPKGASHGRVSDRAPGPLYSAMFAVWALAVAFDKGIKLAAARRAVARGFVVITDRFPQNENPQFNDGPLLDRIARAPAWLRRIERAVYERASRRPPDLVIKLHADSATVARREPDMRRDLILQRINDLKQLSCGGANTVSFDASLPLAEVTRLVRRAVWGIL